MMPTHDYEPTPVPAASMPSDTPLWGQQLMAEVRRVGQDVSRIEGRLERGSERHRNMNERLNKAASIERVDAIDARIRVVEDSLGRLLWLLVSIMLTLVVGGAMFGWALSQGFAQAAP